MRIRTKLAWLELAEGLLSLVWILASILSLYFLAAALVGGGSWAQALATALLSAAARWLAKLLGVYKERAALEAAG